MFKGGIRKKRKFIIYRSSIFGDLSLIDLVVFFIFAGFTLLFVYLFHSFIVIAVVSILILWVIFLWLIWEAGDYKGYELVILMFTYLFKPKTFPVTYFTSDEETVIFEVINGVNVNQLETAKKHEFIEGFNNFLSVNKYPLKIVKTSARFPIVKNTKFLKQKKLEEQDKNKKKIIENFIDQNEREDNYDNDFSIYLQFKINSKDDIKVIENSLRDIEVELIKVEKTDLTERDLFVKILNYPTDVIEKNDSLSLVFNEKRYGSANISKINFHLNTLNELWMLDFIFNPYINFVISIEDIEQNEAIKTYEKYIRYLKTTYVDTKKDSEEIEIENQFMNNREILEDIIIGRDRLFKTDFTIIIHTTLEENLKQIYRDIKNISKPKGVYLTSVFYDQNEQLFNLLKFNNFKQKYYLMPQSTLTQVYPFLNHNYVDEKGLFIGYMDDYKPVIYNPLSLENRSNFINLVIGKTGSGKTTLVKLLTLILLTLSKSKIFIVDPHDEYDVFLEWFKGNKISFNKNRTMNPLSLSNISFENYDSFIASKINSIINFLKIIFEDDEINNKGIFLDLSVDIKNFYKAWVKRGLKNLEPTFSDYNKWTNNDEIKQKVLVHFVDGLYSEFDKPQDIDIKDDLTIFNLIEASKTSNKSIRKAYFFLVINFLNEVMYENKNTGKFNSYIVDEAHIVFNDEISLISISRMIREARKFNTMILLGSQNITDFQSIDNNIVSTIFSNTSNIFVGKIEGDQIDSLKSLLSTKSEPLTEVEISYLKRERGNFLYFNEQERINLKVSFDSDIGDLILKQEQVQNQQEF